MRSCCIVGLVCGALLLSNTARADIYECKGRDGALHYSSKRIPGKRCKLKVRSSRKPTVTAQSSAKPTARERQTKRVIDQTVEEAARKFALPISLIRAVIRVESNFNPTVVSRVGAQGLMQLMPRTARAMGVSDPMDARQNILGGSRYLRILANRFGGDVVLTLAAYNAGEGAVQKYQGIPPYAETQRYVRRVLGHYYAYRGK